MAACRCLHSLSRSVQQIRYWRGGEERVEILECGAMQLQHLVELCQNQDDPTKRRNGVIGLMNMADNANMWVKVQILDQLGTDVLSSLLSDYNQEIIMCTLGLLRNLLSKRQDVDNVMAAYGTTALQAVAVILHENRHPMRIKEQALCVLANISNGVSSKMALLNKFNNADVMEQLMDILKTSDEVKLQVAVIFVIKNLLSGEDDDAVNRMQHLRDQGVQPHLQRLAHSMDLHVQMRAKSALRHFTS
ncbi:hypothetical protein ACOMHN_012952 [Nucella lapillus]